MRTLPNDTNFNLIPVYKRDFEDGTVNGWSPGGNTTIVASTDFARTGTHSLKTTRTTTAGSPRAGYINSAFVEDPPPSLNAGIPVTPGQTYTVMSWHYCDHLAHAPVTSTAPADLIQQPFNTAFTTPNSMSVIIEMALNDYISGTNQDVASRWDNTNNSSWIIRITTGGAVQILTRQTGTNRTWTSTVTLSTRVADGEKIFLLCSLLHDNGAGNGEAKFWTSPDGISWEQLGATSTAAGFNGTQNVGNRPIAIGGRTDTTGSAALGKYYSFELRSGTTDPGLGTVGTTLVKTIFKNQTNNTVTFIDNTSYSWTLPVPIVGGHTVRYNVSFWNVSGTQVGSTVTSSLEKIQYGEWTFIYYVFSAPNDATITLASFSYDYTSTVPVGESHYMDDPGVYLGVLLAQPPDPPPAFFQGTIPSGENLISKYMFLVTDLLTGQVIDEVELASLSWDEVWNRPHGGSATARMDVSTTTKQNFESWQNALWVVKDGDIRWGGFMGNVQPRGGTRVINVPLHGFEEYLRYQLITSVNDMAEATSKNGGLTARWVNSEQFEIVRDLFTHGQRGIINQDIGLTVTWDAASGILRTDEVSRWDAKFVGEKFEEMSDNINGFDWYYEYYWSNTMPRIPRVRVKLKYPAGPRITGIVLEYDNDPGQCNIRTYDADGGQRPAFRMLGLGEGDGKTMKQTFVNAQIPNHVNYDDVYSNKEVKNLTTLQNQTRGVQRLRDKVRDTLQITLESTKEPHYTEFRPGEAVTVKIDDEWTQINGDFTVVSKGVTLSDTHDEEVKLNLLDIMLEPQT